ncbi:MAG TPA: hypothetical protein VGF77_18355 [Allosphingosinicella sp.]|jgi:hypothetical protein
MKNWFPLTSYDFYAYLTAGMVVLAAYDRGFMGSSLAYQQWTVAGGVFWAAVAYLLGQIVAMPSAVLLEHLLARRFLRPPTDIILGLDRPRWRERIIARVSGAREYEPFPAANRTRILEKLGKALNVLPTAVEGEAAFECAFPHARSVADSATRLDNFLNQYGMCRNVSFASLLAAAILGLSEWRIHDSKTTAFAIGALILAIGLFLRFVKFYAAYARELFRAYDKCAS